MSDKDQTNVEGCASKHEENGKWNESHVPKVEGWLQDSAHATSFVVEVEGIYIDKETRHSTIYVGNPPPAMIFSCQLEVQQRNRNEGRDNDQKDKRK